MPVLHPTLQRTRSLETTLLARNPQNIINNPSALDIFLLILVWVRHDRKGFERARREGRERAARLLARGTQSICSARSIYESVSW